MDLRRCAFPRRRPAAVGRVILLVALLLVAVPASVGLTAGARAAAAGVPPRAPARLVTGDDPAIAQVVAAGRMLPAQPILAVRGAGNTVVLRIVSGAARFEGDRAEVTVAVEAPGRLDQPAVRPGPRGDRSVIEVRAADGAFAADSRIVFTASDADLAQLLRLIVPPDPAYLDIGAHHVVIDLRAVRDTRSVTVLGAGAAGRAPSVGADAPAAQHGWEAPGASSPPGSAPDTCRQPADGPGRVVWAFDDPAGAGFAVKPQGGGPLVRARGPSQGADGLYRHDWGCCTAFRIPNGCTVTVLGRDGSFEACCNLIAWLAGRRLDWVDPCALADWPDCPLP